MKQTYSLSNNKGASSILVIILMVVLMIFGLAILTTSLANQRLATKKRAWLVDYYQLEGAVEITLAHIDEQLQSSYLHTNDYLSTNNYITDYLLDAPVISEQSPYLQALVYMDYVTEALTNYTTLPNSTCSFTFQPSTYNYQEVLNGKPIQPSTLIFDQVLDTDTTLPYPKHIQVTLSILSLNQISLQENTFKPYQIIQYLEWQPPFDYEDRLKFENPFDASESLPDNPFNEINE